MGIFYHMQINKAYLFILKAYQTSAFEQSPFIHHDFTCFL